MTRLLAHVHPLEAGLVLARVGRPGFGMHPPAGEEGQIRREPGDELDGLGPDEALGVFPQPPAGAVDLHPLDFREDVGGFQPVGDHPQMLEPRQFFPPAGRPCCSRP